MDRSTDSIFSYCRELVRAEGQELSDGAVLVKVLTSNDDSGRHGVVIPAEAHDFFPEIEIADRTRNATAAFDSRDCLSHRPKELKYKYYQRYPERRITSLNTAFNDRSQGIRVGIFLRARHPNGTTGYYVDLVRQNLDAEFDLLCGILFGDALAVQEGLFLQRQVDSPVFQWDDALTEFIDKFDDIANRGYIESLRTGDTGIGYTFETLCGIEENNDQTADFRGIEIKCKQVKESELRQGKINLFQNAPKWNAKSTGIERLRLLGRLDSDGRYACYSQVSGTPNNLGLQLRTDLSEEQIDLLRNDVPFGYWPHPVLTKRLKEKHSRAVFVKAQVRTSGSRQSFHYKEIVYCERPSISRFVDLVESRRIVFEFLMSERGSGKVRNHGYPWRLIREDFLSDLFSLRVKLR
jgi:MvaI/BcnI restriction endonuclease family